VNASSLLLFALSSYVTPGYIHLYPHTRLTVTHHTQETLPDSIGELGDLQTLNVRGNRLAALPATIGRLGRLRTLTADDNVLTALPIEMHAMKALDTLTITGNPLAFPRPGMHLERGPLGCCLYVPCAVHACLHACACVPFCLRAECGMYEWCTPPFPPAHTHTHRYTPIHLSHIHDPSLPPAFICPPLHGGGSHLLQQVLLKK